MCAPDSRPAAEPVVAADADGFVRRETLRSGLPVTIRALRPDDRERIAAAFRKLDRDSIYTRLFSYRSELSEADLNRIVNVDRGREVALLVTIGAGDNEVVIGSGRCVAAGADARSAEVAFMVEEDYHGLGIASRLLAHLVDIARARGITTLEADVLAENAAMLSVFARSRLPMKQQRDGGVMHVTLDLRPAAA